MLGVNLHQEVLSTCWHCICNELKLKHHLIAPEVNSTAPLHMALYTECDPSGSSATSENTVLSSAPCTFLQAQSHEVLSLATRQARMYRVETPHLNLSRTNIGMIFCSMVTAAEQLSPLIMDGNFCTATVTSLSTVASSLSLPAALLRFRPVLLMLASTAG